MVTIYYKHDLYAKINVVDHINWLFFLASCISKAMENEGYNFTLLDLDDESEFNIIQDDQRLFIVKTSDAGILRFYIDLNEEGETMTKFLEEYNQDNPFVPILL